MKKISFIILVIYLGLISCKKENEITLKVYSPTKNGAINSNLDSVLIDFEISASEHLYPVDIRLFDNRISLPNYPGVSAFNSDGMMMVYPTTNSYRFTTYVDLSSYPSGSSFSLYVKTDKIEPTSEKYVVFTDDIQFTIQ